MNEIASITRTPLSTAVLDTIVSAAILVETSGFGFVDLTGEIKQFVHDAGAVEGLVTLFTRHTSASLTIQENADPSVLDNLLTALDRLAPQEVAGPMTPRGPTICRRISAPC
jgi:Uncharacterised protein family UPF0047